MLNSKLHTLSPLATLDRGYAIATRKGHVIQNTGALKEGDEVSIQLAKGTFESSVTKINKE